MAFAKGFLMLFILASVRYQMTVAGQFVPMNPGVCYGRKGDNLPPPSKVVAMYSQYGIQNMRLFEPDLDVLDAVGSLQKIEFTLGVLNQDIPNLVNLDAAKSWYDKYVHNFRNVATLYITVGNEVIPSEYSSSVLTVMRNFQSIIDSYGSANYVGVTTVVSMDILAVSYPPSGGAFKHDVSGVLTDVLGFLGSHNYPLMLNAYPYFAYAGNPGQVRQDYALFTATAPVVHDQGLEYWNLLDAMVDSVYAAMEKVGMPHVDIFISETGWPSAGNGEFTTTGLAATYNQNVLKKFQKQTGTPRRPSSKLSGYIFAMFNEDLKPAGIEQNFGLFYPDGRPVYPVFG